MALERGGNNKSYARCEMKKKRNANKRRCKNCREGRARFSGLRNAGSASLQTGMLLAGQTSRREQHSLAACEPRVRLSRSAQTVVRYTLPREIIGPRMKAETFVEMNNNSRAVSVHSHLFLSSFVPVVFVVSRAGGRCEVAFSRGRCIIAFAFSSAQFNFRCVFCQHSHPPLLVTGVGPQYKSCAHRSFPFFPDLYHWLCYCNTPNDS